MIAVSGSVKTIPAPRFLLLIPHLGSGGRPEVDGIFPPMDNFAMELEQLSIGVLPPKHGMLPAKLGLLLLLPPQLPGAKLGLLLLLPPKLLGAKLGLPLLLPQLPGAKLRLLLPQPQLPGAKLGLLLPPPPQLPGAKLGLLLLLPPPPQLPGAKLGLPLLLPQLPGAKLGLLLLPPPQLPGPKLGLLLLLPSQLPGAKLAVLLLPLPQLPKTLYLLSAPGAKLGPWLWPPPLLDHPFMPGMEQGITSWYSPSSSSSSTRDMKSGRRRAVASTHSMTSCFTGSRGPCRFVASGARTELEDGCAKPLKLLLLAPAPWDDGGTSGSTGDDGFVIPPMELATPMDEPP